MTEPDPLLRRAASFLRTSPEPGWEAISARVLAAVHAAPRASWPLRTISSMAGQGAVFISDHALRSIIARELRRRYLCQPTRVSFVVDGTELRAVEITITGSYGTQLLQLGNAIRESVINLIVDILGGPAGTNGGTGRPIDVIVTDVVEGDPLDQ